MVTVTVVCHVRLVLAFVSVNMHRQVGVQQLARRRRGLPVVALMWGWKT